MKNTTVLNNKIAVIYPQFGGGGAECVCMWILHALAKEGYETYLISFTRVDFKKWDAFFGTSCVTLGVKQITPRLGHLLYDKLLGKPPLMTIKQFAMSTWVRKHLKGWYKISAYNEMDLGEPGLQYIHFPQFDDTNDEIREIGRMPNQAWRKIYRRLMRRLFSVSINRKCENLTVANSAWTASIVKKLYDIPCKVIYPPVTNMDGNKETKEPYSFVSIGRISPEKNLIQVINILAEIRKTYPITYHLICGGKANESYKRKVLEAVKPHASWINLHDKLNRKEYTTLLCSCTYGLHGMANEHFGISIAEMVKAGVLPFIPSEGGQTEIVDHTKELMYKDTEDAIKKITRILYDKALEKALLDKVKAHNNRFSEVRFCNDLISIIDEEQKK